VRQLLTKVVLTWANLRSISSVSLLPSRSLSSTTFTDANFCINDPDHDNLVVVTTIIVNWQVKKVLIHWESLIAILYRSTFHKLDIFTLLIKSYLNYLLKFNPYTPTFDTYKTYQILIVQYILVEVDTFYNIFITSWIINWREVIVSTFTYNYEISR